MKKRTLFILILVLFIFIVCFLINVNAQPNPADLGPDLPGFAKINPETGNLEGVEKVTETIENLSEGAEKRKYITNEWDKILAKYQVKNNFIRLVYFFHKLFEIFSPAIKLFTGVSYSLTGFFLIVISIWILVVFIIYNTIRNIADFEDIYCFLIAILIPTLASHVKINNMGTFEFCAYLIGPLITNLVFLILFFALVILIGFFYDHFMEEVRKLEEEEEEREMKKGLMVYWNALKHSLGLK